MPLICASLKGEKPEDFLKSHRDIQADILEIRADGLMDCTPESVHNILTQIKKETSAKLLLTVRWGEEGGLFKGSEEERKAIILGNLHLIDMVDVELKSQIRGEVVKAARSNGINVILSHHNFEKTPDSESIKKTVEAEIKAGADYAKIAYHAANHDDVLRLLRITASLSKDANMIAISMGEIGMISRIAAPYFGSMMTYASVGDPTAPGQMTVEQTIEAFNMLGI